MRSFKNDNFINNIIFNMNKNYNLIMILLIGEFKFINKIFKNNTCTMTTVFEGMYNPIFSYKD